MFSRYKKQSDAKPVNGAPVAAPVAEAANADAPAPVAEAPAPQQPKFTRRPMPNAPAKAKPADKERKRKERLGEIKLELHRELLDNLNLAALESASESDLRNEISAISAEVEPVRID